MRLRFPTAMVAWLALALAAHAAGRAWYGGTLRIAVVGKMAEADPLYADAPLEAALISLVAQPLCRLDGRLRLEPALAAELSPGLTSTLEVRLAEAPRADGKRLTAQDAALALKRALTDPTPYRGLLLPLADESAVVAVGADRLTLKLAFPWPDLDRALCHPAMALARTPRTDGAGPFLAATTPGNYTPQRGFPRGRPFVSNLVMVSADARAAGRLLTQKKAQLALGISPADAPTPAMLSATYLLWSAARAGPEVRVALEKATNREDLKYFVRAPSAPMLGLLPPALAGAATAAPPPKAAVAGAGRSLSLSYDASNEDHRAVAERLQVRLQSSGYRVALEPLPRRALRAAWANGEYTLMLQQVLLPPVPAPALAVVATLSRKPEVLQRLKSLGAVADSKERDDKTRALANELLPQVDLLPLYVQGLAMQSTGQVQQLTLDGFGLPRLEDTFLSGEAP